MTRSRLCILCAVAAAAASAMLLRVNSAPADEPPVSFIGDVAPILKEHCYACHDTKKRSGKFEVTTYAKFLKGGAGDEAIVPGKSQDSHLVELLRADGERRMPPPPKDKVSDKDGALPPAKIATIERWIQQGAKLDAGIDPNADLLRELRVRWQPPAPPATYPQPVPVTALAFAPDGKRLVASGYHELTAWDVADGKLVQRIRTRAERTFAMTFVGNLLVVAGGRPGQEGTLDVYDLAGPSKSVDGVSMLDGVDDAKVHVKHLFDTDDTILCIAVRPDGKRLAAGGCDRLVRVWDLADGLTNARLEATVENHADWVLGVSLTGNGQLLTAGRDKTAKRYDLGKKESVQTFPDHQAPVYGVVPRGDGKAALSVGADKMLRVWAFDDGGKKNKASGGHGDDVYKIVAVPGQSLVVTCGADKSVRLWKDDGTPVRTCAGLADHVYALAVSPDGNFVAAGAYDGEVRVWKLSNGAVAKAFNASPGYVTRTTAK